MSYNITVDVAEDGTATLNAEASYTKTAAPGRYVLSGHHVAEGEDGHQYVAATTPTGERVSGGHAIRA